MALENVELVEIRTRNKKEQNDTASDLRKSHFVEHYMEPDDTLAKLSLIYCCTVCFLFCPLAFFVLLRL